MPDRESVINLAIKYYGCQSDQVHSVVVDSSLNKVAKFCSVNEFIQFKNQFPDSGTAEADIKKAVAKYIMGKPDTDMTICEARIIYLAACSDKEESPGDFAFLPFFRDHDKSKWLGKLSQAYSMIRDNKALFEL